MDRLWFWGYFGGSAFAAALCGLVAAPSLMYFMRLDPREREWIATIGVLAAVILPISACLLAMARRFSVPQQLQGMTDREWECVGVSNLTVSARPPTRGQIVLSQIRRFIGGALIGKALAFAWRIPLNYFSSDPRASTRIFVDAILLVFLAIFGLALIGGERKQIAKAETARLGGGDGTVRP